MIGGSLSNLVQGWADDRYIQQASFSFPSFPLFYQTIICSLNFTRPPQRHFATPIRSTLHITFSLYSSNLLNMSTVNSNAGSGLLELADPIDTNVGQCRTTSRLLSLNDACSEDIKERGCTLRNFRLDDEEATVHRLSGGTIKERQKEIRSVRGSLSFVLACLN